MDSVYAPQDSNAQGNNQDDSSVYISNVDSVYAPPGTIFPVTYQDDSLYISASDNIYTAPDATYFEISPPQLSNDISLALESSQNIDDSNVRGYRRTRRARTRTADLVEGPREVHKSKVRKGRRKHQG